MKYVCPDCLTEFDEPGNCDQCKKYECSTCGGEYDADELEYNKCPDCGKFCSLIEPPELEEES